MVILGSIVSAALVIQEMEPGKCIEMFTEMARQVFQNNATGMLLLPVTIYRRLRWLLDGAKYNKNCLSNALQHLFEPNQLLKDVRKQSVNNVRVAFTTTDFMSNVHLYRNYPSNRTRGEALYKDDGSITVVGA
jgi:patatin-like phospholipase/acyl hydrolase